ARNIYASFGDSSVNECTIQSWSTKFQSGDKSLANEDSDWPETVAYNKVLPAIVQQNSGNPVKNYPKELGATPTTIFCHLKRIDKVKKKKKDK
ncbi:hypothetical protein TNCT_211721, partial [Trichonephila clavata]